MTRCRPVFSVLRLFLLCAGALVILFPYLWMLSASMKSPSELFSSPLSLWPEQQQAAYNYVQALTRVPLLHFLLNGAIVCALILSMQLVLAVPCAYALARTSFRGAKILFVLVVLGLLVPPQATALPIYLALDSLGLLNTMAALILPFALSVFAIFLFRQFFKAFPGEIIQAARLDGMGEHAIVWRIVVPNIWPAISAFSLFSVIAHWNDLFWPLIVVGDIRLATPPLGLIFFRAADSGDDYTVLMAAAVIVTAPLVALFLTAQRAFIEGVATTGLKG